METNFSTRQFEIIEAAGKILSRSGVSGLTIKNLAKEMNFSESAIYRHFQSKEEIILAMLSFLAENMQNRISQLVKKDPISDFITIFESQFEFFSKNPHFVVAVFSQGLFEESKKINDAILKIMSVKMKFIVTNLEEGQKQNLFINTLTPMDLVHIIMGSFRLLMFRWQISNFQFEIIDEGRKLIQNLLILISLDSKK